MRRIVRFLRIVALGAALVTPLLAPSEANADSKAEAAALYRSATEAMSNERFEEAALGFEAASALHPHAVALYTAAQAWEAAGQPERAADAYALALRTPKLDESQRARANERLDELTAELGTVVVNGTEGIRAKLDDHSEMGVAARLHGVPGTHVLTLTASDGGQRQLEVTLEKGRPIEVDADSEFAKIEKGEVGETGSESEETVEPPPPPPPTQTLDDSEPNHLLSRVGYLTTGAGVALLGGGALLGISARDAEDTYNDSPTQATYDHAKGLQNRTNVLFIAGSVVTATGVGLIVYDTMISERKEAPRRSGWRRDRSGTSSVRVKLAPTGVWAEGRF